MVLGPLGGGIDAEGGGRELGSSDSRCPRCAGLRGPSGISFSGKRGWPLVGRGLCLPVPSKLSVACSRAVWDLSAGSAEGAECGSSFSLGFGASRSIRLMTGGRLTLEIARQRLIEESLMLTPSLRMLHQLALFGLDLQEEDDSMENLLLRVVEGLELPQGHWEVLRVHLWDQLEPKPCRLFSPMAWSAITVKSVNELGVIVPRLHQKWAPTELSIPSSPSAADLDRK